MWVLRPTQVYRVQERQIVAGRLLAGQPVQTDLPATVYEPSGRRKAVLIRGTGHFHLPTPARSDEFHYLYEGPEIQPDDLREGTLLSDVGYDEALRLIESHEELPSRN